MTPPAGPTLSNEHLQVGYVPDRGGTITSLRRVRDDLELLWQAPWGTLPLGTPRPPQTAVTAAMESWSGGWRTLFPNAGRNVTLYGTDLGTDGEACLAPYAATAPDGGHAVTLSTRLVRVPVRLERTLTLDGPVLRVDETIGNEGGQDLEVMWAQELCFGAPLLSSSTTITTGATIVRPDPDTTHSVGYDDVMPWPRTQGNDGVVNLRRALAEGVGQTRRAYLSDFADARATISNPDLQVGVELRWDAAQMPFCWYDLEAGGREDFPHYSASYYLALAPSTSWPRQGVHDARRVSATSVRVPAGEQLSSWVELQLI